MAIKFDDYDESKSNVTAYKGTAEDDNVTNIDIDFSGWDLYTFEGNDTVTIEADSRSFIEIYDGLGNDTYKVTKPATYNYLIDLDHIVELDFKGLNRYVSLKFAPHEFDGSLHTLDVDMTLGEAIYKTATSESIDTFSGISKIDITAFTSFYSQLKVSLKGNNESNIFRILDGTKATIDGGSGTDLIDIVTQSDLVVDLRDQSGTKGTFKNIEGIIINYKISPGNITLIGDEKDNIFKSGDGDDTIYGYGGNDFIYVDSGTDIHYGGEGNDTAIFSSTYRDHIIEIDPDNPTKVTISGEGRPSNSEPGNIGINEFNNFEFFRFAGSKYELKSGKLIEAKEQFEDKSAGIIYDVGITEIFSREKHDGFKYDNSVSGIDPVFPPDFYGYDLIKTKQGDFNGDGLQDAVIFGVSNFWGMNVNNPDDLIPEQSEKITILLNDGKGSFVSGQHLINGNSYYRVDAYGGDVGDLNNDGIDDIVSVAAPDKYTVRDDGIVILMSQPDGTFSDVTSTIVDERYLTERDDKEVLQYGSRSLTIEDFDGDGWKDIYLENNLAETNALLFNNKGKSFGEKEGGTESYLPQYARYGFNHRAGDSMDFDQDGDQDIIAIPRVYKLIEDATWLTSQDIDYAYGFVLINDGTGDFNEVPPILLPAGLKEKNNKIDDMVTGDINGDGYPDVIIASGKFDPYYVDRDIQILINDSGTKLNDETNTRIINLRDDNSGTPEGALYLIDFNDDGHLDIIDFQQNVENGIAYGTAAPGTEFPYFHTGIAIFVNDGEGYFTAVEKDITKGIENVGFNDGAWSPVDFGPDYGVGFVFTYRPTEPNYSNTIADNTFYDNNDIWGISTVRTTEKVYAGPDLKNPAKEGFPGFDENYYLRVNSDAKTSVDNGEYSSALEHYKSVGQSENLQTFAKGTKVHGYSGNDTIVLREGDEIAYGYTGNDSIEGGAGNDNIDGGAGSDTAIFKDASSAFTITTNDNGSISVIHSSPSDGLIDEGSDTLTGVEKIQFSDKTVSSIPLKYSLSETIDTTKNILKSYSPETQSGTQNYNSGDNIIIADGQAKTLRGLDGDDTYFISNLLPENSSITIIDTSGTNTIQIPSNTKVTKSQWAKDTVRLTFEDSRVITVNNADTFSYNLGGNVTNGTAGTDLTFSDLSLSFGVDDLSVNSVGTIVDLYIV